MFFESPVSHDRVERAREWLLAKTAAGPLLVVAASADAAGELLRSAARERGAGFGWHRATLGRLAMDLATGALAEQGLVPVGRLGSEAVVARVVHEMEGANRLGRLASVSRCSGFACAAASLLAELRLAEIAGSRPSGPAGAPSGSPLAKVAPEVGALLEAYDEALRAARLADRAALLGLAASEAEKESCRHPLLGLPLLLLDVPLWWSAECRLVRALARRAPEVFATVPSGDGRTLGHLVERIGMVDMVREPKSSPGEVIHVTSVLPGIEEAAEARGQELTSTALLHAGDEIVRPIGAGPAETAGTGPVSTPRDDTSLARLQAHLFEKTAPPPAPLTDDVVVLSAPGEGRECVEIARRLLQLARAGLPFDRMAILLRSTEEYRAHLHEAFRRAGIPAYFARGTVRPDPAGRAFLALLACAAEGLSARRFAEYLSLGEVPDATAQGAPPPAPPSPDRWVPPDEELVPEAIADALEEQAVDRPDSWGEREQFSQARLVEPRAGVERSGPRTDDPLSGTVHGTGPARSAAPGSTSPGATTDGGPSATPVFRTDARPADAAGAAGSHVTNPSIILDASTAPHTSTIPDTSTFPAPSNVPDPSPAPVTAGTLRAPRRWEQLLVDAAVIGGRDRWKKRIDGLEHELRLDLEALEDPEGSEAARIRRTLSDLDSLRDFALPLLDALAELPRRAPWGEWLERLSALATRSLRRPERVLALLAELAPMARVGPVDLGEIQIVLSRRLLELSSAPREDRHGRVFVAPIDSVRGLAFDVVCVPGLAERLFPKKVSEEPILSDRVRKELSSALPLNDDRVARERLALRLAVGAARRKLLISYPRLDLDQGRPRVPSFYALEVLRAAEGRLPGFEELARRAETVTEARVGWPAPASSEDAIDEAEHDLALLARLLHEETSRGVRAVIDDDAGEAPRLEGARELGQRQNGRAKVTATRGSQPYGAAMLGAAPEASSGHRHPDSVPRGLASDRHVATPPPTAAAGFPAASGDTSRDASRDASQAVSQARSRAGSRSASRTERGRGAARYLLTTNPHLARALRFRARRWIKRWTEADGLVPRSDGALAAGAREAMQASRLEARSFSPTALQHYAACPYRFFLQAVHRLAPREVPEAIDEMDPLSRGSLVHEVQFELFQKLEAERLLPVTADTLERARAALDETLDRVAARYEDDLAPAIDRVWQDGIAGVRADLREWLRRASEDASGFVPWLFELSFGLGGRRQRDRRSRRDPVPLDCGILLRGSIDLVERRGDGRIRVTDHKTGRDYVKAGAVVAGGASLQPVLYALAAEKMFAEEPVESGRLYYCTTAGGFKEVEVLLDADARESARAAAAAVGAALTDAFLPAMPADRACRFCDYAVVCGPYEETRSARKPRREPHVKALEELRKMP